ncbi:hypothetical protein DIZ27_38710 [Streptomyces sp. NWU339]|uniref:hypothetical protein n=1 Tax=Streptomyces sp. NWU339 TaxID=2185284 RepID=UPI000D6822AF|nr:hypothetical protein [Streptomyces sp. NWU339]PWI05539.1 hypothetical protein DIZ27_38710 [Streptomyces sp. NWU339]
MWLPTARDHAGTVLGHLRVMRRRKDLSSNKITIERAPTPADEDRHEFLVRRSIDDGGPPVRSPKGLIRVGRPEASGW